MSGKISLRSKALANKGYSYFKDIVLTSWRNDLIFFFTLMSVLYNGVQKGQ